MMKRGDRPSSAFSAAVLIAAFFIMCWSRPTFAQTQWLIGNWSFESDVELAIQRGNPDFRRFGNSRTTKNGRVIEIYPIAAAFGVGKLQGFMRDSGEVAWIFIYDKTADGCNGGASRTPSVTLNPAKREIQIRVSNFSGQNCDYDSPWIATLYRQ
jgi:hypothetical protein